MSERDLDIVLDHLGTLNDLTPKLRCEGKSGVPPSLIFGLDSKQFLEIPGTHDKDHHSEVETLTLSRGITEPHTDQHHSHSHAHSVEPEGEIPLLTRDLLTDALDALPKDSVYRVKGFVSFQNAPEGILVLNWAFGRFELVPLTTTRNPVVQRMKAGDALLTVMGAAGEVRRYGRKLGQSLGARLG